MSKVFNPQDLIHGRIRLATLAYLSANGPIDFVTLRTHLEVTDGNLSVHLRKLEDTGYIRQKKGFVARRPRTTITLTPKGQAAFEAYLTDLEAFVKDTRLAQTA